MAEKLYRKTNNGYEEVYPLNFIQNIFDSESGNTLTNVLSSFNNIYLPFQNDVEETRNLVPNYMRRKGLWITYNNGIKYITEYYKGEAEDIQEHWSDDINWEVVPDLEFVQSEASKLPDGIITPEKLSPALQQLIKQNNTITNLPDDEDLQERNGVMSFKDRKYNPYLASGKGYKILRKNWVKSRNILTQDMINETNTIYEIRYDFDLQGQTINLPKGATLLFKGGAINNGSVYFNGGTIIGADKFSDCGNASFTGEFSKGLIMSFDDTPKWWNGTEWVAFASGEGEEPSGYEAEIVSAETTDDKANATVKLAGKTFSFTFAIPRGKQGPQGPQGIPGPAGADGIDGQDGADGKDGVTLNYKTYVYKKADSAPAKPTGTSLIPTGWSDYPDSSGQWWQSIGTVNGITNKVTEWSAVLPVNGKDGTAQDGSHVEMRFAVNASRTTAPKIDVSQRNPSGWTINPPSVTEGNYLWMTTATIKPDDFLKDTWSTPVCISGEQGPQGGDGPAGDRGQMVYPAGVYDVNKTYVTDSNRAPYVLDKTDGNYYVLNAIMIWKGTEQNNRTPSEDYEQNQGRYWLKFDAFDAIYAKIGIIANGLVGSAVFNGDYMFSQQGINPSSSNATTTNYENFDSSKIYNGTFTPNILFNFATGAGHLAAGKIKFNESGDVTLNNLYMTGYVQENYKVVTSGATSVDFDPETKNYIFTETNTNFVTIDSENMFKSTDTVKEINIYNGGTSGQVNLNTYQWDNWDLNIIDNAHSIKHISIKPGRCVKLIVFKVSDTMSGVRTIIANKGEFMYDNDEKYGGYGIISKDLA